MYYENLVAFGLLVPTPQWQLFASLGNTVNLTSISAKIIHISKELKKCEKLECDLQERIPALMILRGHEVSLI